MIGAIAPIMWPHVIPFIPTTIKAINNLTGPNNIILILLIFSIYSQLIKISLSFLLVIKKSKAIYITTKKVCCLYIKKLIKDTLIIHNSLNIKNTLDLFL
jgi:hypothetical protein